MLAVPGTGILVYGILGAPHAVVVHGTVTGYRVTRIENASTDEPTTYADVTVTYPGPDGRPRQLLEPDTSAHLSPGQEVDVTYNSVTGKARLDNPARNRVLGITMDALAALVLLLGFARSGLRRLRR